MQMNVVKSLKYALIVAAGLMACALRAGEIVNPARAAEIAAMLPANPTGFGQPITNRTAWANAFASGSPANNPRVPSSDEIIELYRRVYA